MSETTTTGPVPELPLEMQVPHTMKIPVLILALVAALLLQPARQITPCASRIESIRAELAGVQIELMGVMRTDSGATSCLRSQEERLKYALRAEEIVTASASASMAASSASLNGPSGASPEPKHPQSTCMPSA